MEDDSIFGLMGSMMEAAGKITGDPEPVSLPYVKNSSTSKEAAKSMEKVAPAILWRVFGFIARQNERGATDDEIEAALDLRHQTASARRRELVLKGLVDDSGEKRRTRSGRNATVWVAKVEDEEEDTEDVESQEEGFYEDEEARWEWRRDRVRGHRSPSRRSGNTWGWES